MSSPASSSYDQFWRDNEYLPEYGAEVDRAMALEVGEQRQEQALGNAHGAAANKGKSHDVDAGDIGAGGDDARLELALQGAPPAEPVSEDDGISAACNEGGSEALQLSSVYEYMRRISEEDVSLIAVSLKTVGAGWIPKLTDGILAPVILDLSRLTTYLNVSYGCLSQSTMFGMPVEKAAVIGTIRSLTFGDKNIMVTLRDSARGGTGAICVVVHDVDDVDDALERYADAGIAPEAGVLAMGTVERSVEYGRGVTFRVTTRTMPHILPRSQKDNLLRYMERQDHLVLHGYTMVRRIRLASIFKQGDAWRTVSPKSPHMPKQDAGNNSAGILRGVVHAAQILENTLKCEQTSRWLAPCRSALDLLACARGALRAEGLWERTTISDAMETLLKSGMAGEFWDEDEGLIWKGF